MILLLIFLAVSWRCRSGEGGDVGLGILGMKKGNMGSRHRMLQGAVSDPVWEKPLGMTGILSSVVCLGRM